MTPALLPGFQALVHMETEQPCLIQSDDPKAYVQGMLIFGEGKGGREQVHKHYRPEHKRMKIQVEIEINVPVPSTEREDPDERWIGQRKRLWAHAWLWSNVRDFDSQFRSDVREWKMEEYVGGKYTMHKTMRVEKNGLGEDYCAEDENEAEVEREQKLNVEAASAEPWLPEPEPELQSGGTEGLADSADIEDEEGRFIPSRVPCGGLGGLYYERSDDAIGKW